MFNPFKPVRNFMARVSDTASLNLIDDLRGQIAQMRSDHKAEVRLLEEEIKLRDLQVKNLVAENQRNHERIKAETAGFSAQISYTTGGGNK